MAADNGGTRNYVEPHEDIEVAVSSLFKKMNEPVLVNVELNFGEIITKELSPRNLPDLFREEQLTLLGRYESHGDATLKLRGDIGDERQEFSKDVHFSKLTSAHDFLPHLWAQSRIAELVDEVALNGGNEELHKEIERLSKEYGVLTPYTSFVQAADGSLVMDYQSTVSEAYSPAMPVPDRIRRSRGLEDLKTVRQNRQYEHTKRTGDKIFRHMRRGTLESEIWVDSQYDGKSERKQIEFGSKDYYELMNHLPDLAKYAKLAKDALSMIICYKGVNYEITPPTV